MQVAKVRLDTRLLDNMAKSLGVNTDRALAAIAFQGKAIVQNSMVGPGPSAPGSPPAPDTGNLKSFIDVTRKSEDLYWLHDGVEYGIYLELGTSKMAARPFMVPGIELLRNQFYKRFGGLFP